VVLVNVWITVGSVLSAARPWRLSRPAQGALPTAAERLCTGCLHTFQASYDRLGTGGLGSGGGVCVGCGGLPGVGLTLDKPLAGQLWTTGGKLQIQARACRLI